MRIDAINTASGFYRYEHFLKQNATESKVSSVIETSKDEFQKMDESVATGIKPSFKGKGRMLGGLLGGTTGTLAGIGLGALITIGTGGLAAPLIAGMAGCALGSASGSEIGDKLDENSEKDDDYSGSDDFNNYYP